MILRCTVGLIALFALGFASRALLEYLADSQQRGVENADAMNTLAEGEVEPTAGELAAVTNVGADVAPDSTLAPESGGEAAPVLVQFAGRVVDAVSGAPLAGVRVRREAEVLAQTDAQGRFSITRPPHAVFALGMDASGYGLAYVFVDEPLPAGASEHQIGLVRSASLDARVLDATGAPCPGVRISIRAPAHELQRSAVEDPVVRRRRIRPSDPRWTAITDAEGAGRIEGLPSGVALSASVWEADAESNDLHAPTVARSSRHAAGSLPPGCLLAPSRPLILRPGESRDTTWRLERARAPVADAESAPTALSRPPTASRTSGTLRGSSTTRAVAFHEDADGSDLAFAVARARSLFGVLQDDQGAPVGGLLIAARPIGATGATTTTSAPDGTFTIGPLDDGEHDVYVYGGARYGTQSFGPFEPGVELVLELDPGTSIGGIVVDESGSPVAASVALHACTALASRIATTRAGTDGRFVFRNLRPGAYDVVATTSDGRIAVATGFELSPAASQRGIELVVRAGAKLSIESRSGKVVKRAVVMTGEHGFCSLDLRNRIEEQVLVPAGALVVRLFDGTRAVAESRVDVAPGTETAVVLD